MPPVAKDSAKRHSTKRVQYPFRLAGRSPGLTGIQQDRQDQRAKDSHLRLFAQISAAPHTFVQRVHRVPASSQSPTDFWFAGGGRVNHTAR